MPQSPAWNDNKRTLWLKIASNLYDTEVASGTTGLNPPSWNDSVMDLIRKCVYYTS